MSRQLQHWIVANGLTYTELAAALGYGYHAVYQYATGRREVPDSFKWRIAKRYGFEVARSLFDAEPDGNRELR